MKENWIELTIKFLKELLKQIFWKLPETSRKYFLKAIPQQFLNFEMNK